MEALPFQDGALDVVFSSEVFEQLPDDLLEQGVREVGRVLKLDGVLLGTVPYEEPLVSGAERYARAAASSIIPPGTIKASPPGTLRKSSHRRD